MHVIPRKFAGRGKVFDRLFRKERDEALLEHDPRFWQRYLEAYGLVVRGLRTPAAFDGAIREQLEKDADLISFEMEDLRTADEYQAAFDREHDRAEWEELFGDDMDYLEEVEARNTVYTVPDDDWMDMSYDPRWPWSSVSPKDLV